jgi:hypothetical protein
MRDVFAAVAEQADVVLCAFVDDRHVVPTPAEVMNTLTSMPRSALRVAAMQHSLVALRLLPC